MKGLLSAGYGLRTSEKALFGFLVFIGLCVLWVALAVSVPFSPYRSYGYSVAPQTVCTQELVTVTADRAIQDPVLGSVRRLVVESEWREVDTGAVFPVGDAEIPSFESGRRMVTSPVIREAPPVAGTWRLYARYEVAGSVMLMPRVQHLDVESAKNLRVRMCG